MSVLIRGMKMPKVEDEFVEVLIFGDGKVIQTGKSWRCKEDGKCYYESITPELFFHATEIPNCYIVFYYLWDNSAEISGVFWTREDAEQECDDLRSRGLDPWIEQYYIHGCTLNDASIEVMK